MTPLFAAMRSAGMKYGGDITTFCRRRDPGITVIIGGYSGAWWVHEFGGVLFVPFTTDRGYHNRAGFESAN